MMKPFFSLCLASAMLAPVAFAGEPTPIEVSISYDATQLASEVGAARELGSISRQARRACTISQPVSAARLVDRACIDGLVTGAVTQIREKLTAEGGAVSPAFTVNGRMILAQTGQR